MTKASKRSEAEFILPIPHSHMSEISLLTMGRAYQAVVRSTLLCGCETWTVRIADEMMLMVSENCSIHTHLHVRRRDCLPAVELRCSLRITCIPVQLVQRRLRWFGHAARLPDQRLIKDLLLSTPPRTWSRRTGVQLKMRANYDQGRPGSRVFGCALWRKDCVKASSELIQGRRA